MMKAVHTTSKRGDNNNKSASHVATRSTGHQHGRKKEARNEHAVMLTAWCGPLKRRHLHGKQQAGFDPETDTHLRNEVGCAGPQGVANVGSSLAINSGGQ